MKIVLLIMVAVGLVVVSGSLAMAQGVQADMGQSLDSFQDSLSRLIEENRAIDARNMVLRSQLQELEQKIAVLKQEELVLQEQARKAGEKQSQVLVASRDLQERLARAQAELAAVKEDVLEANTVLSQDAMDDELAAQRVLDLRKEIAGIKSGKGLPSVNYADLLSEKADLDRSVNEVTASLEESKKAWQDMKLRQGISEAAASADNSETQEQEKVLAALRSEVAALEADLKEGVPDRTGVQTTTEARFLEAKSRYNRLMAERDRVQREMVVLDKQKAQLEKGVGEKK